MPRGQAALEFLMTYGWAILVVLAAISALAYFGIFNPNRMVGDIYEMGPEFSYAGHVFYHEFKVEPELIIILRSNLPNPVEILANSREVMCHDCRLKTGEWNICGQIYDDANNPLEGPGDPVTVEPGETFRMGCKQGLGTEVSNPIIFNEVGERNKVSFRFMYTEEDKVYGHPYEGIITGTVEARP